LLRPHPDGRPDLSGHGADGHRRLGLLYGHGRIANPRAVQKDDAVSLLPWLVLGPMLLGVGAFVFQGYGRHFYAAAIAAVSALTALTLGAAQTGAVHALGHLAATLGIALRLDM